MIATENYKHINPCVADKVGRSANKFRKLQIRKFADLK